MRVLGRALPGMIFVAVFVAFLPALSGQFLNWDDHINFVGNQGFRGLGWAQLRWMWTTPLMGHYIPFTWMSLGLNYALGGMNPWGYHVGNVLIHAMSTVLFYFVARRLLVAAGIATGSSLLWSAGFAALVFGIHPLRVESVAWITERRDVLCGLFFLLAVWTYLRSVDLAARWVWRLASVAGFGAAFLCKAQAAPLPVALLILDAYPLRRAAGTGWRRLLMEKLPYFAVSLVGSAVAIVAVKKGAMFTNYAQYGPAARLAMTAYGIVFYPWRWLWPVGLSPLYELPAQVDPLAWRFVFPAIALAVVTGLLVHFRHHWPAGFAAWIYSAVMLLPVVGPVHAGNQLAHDRYSYLSGLGFALLAGAGLAWVLQAATRGTLHPLIRHISLAGAGLVLLALGAATWVQAGWWHDSETLWRWAVEADPQCAICLTNLGQTLATQGQMGDAERAFRRSLALREYPMTRNDLGGVIQLQGRLDEAEREYQEALRQKSGLTEGLVNLGELYIKQGRYEEALPLLRRAFQFTPDFPRLRTDLSGALRRRGNELAYIGRLDEAQALFGEALRVQP
jgi:protein O-mannosyl-transferase